MMFNPAFSYALQYFDGLMGSFAPVVQQLAMLMALMTIAWQGFQVAFGTMEVRKYATGIIIKLVIFWLVIWAYPGICAGCKTFALWIGQHGNTEVAASAIAAFNSRINELSEDNESLGALLNGDKDNAVYKASEGRDGKISINWKDFLFTDMAGAISTRGGTGMSNAEKKRAKDKMQENEDTIKGLEKLTENGNFDLALPVTDSHGNAKTVDDGNGNPQTVYHQGMLSLDSVFKVTLLTMNMLMDREFDRDVMLSSQSDEYDMIYEKAYEDAKKSNKDASDNDRKTIAAKNADAAWRAQVALGKVNLSLTNIPFKALLRYALVFICSIFAIIVTCICLIQYSMHMVEYTIVTGFSVLLVPLLLFDGLKDYAMKIVAMLFHETVKLAMVVMMMYYNIALYGNMAQTIMGNKGATSFGLVEFAYIVFSSIMGLALISNAPKLASTVVTGQPQMSMGEFVAAAGSIAGGAMVGVTAAKAGTSVATGVPRSINTSRRAYAEARAGGMNGVQAFMSGAGNAAMSAGNTLLGAFGRQRSYGMGAGSTYHRGGEKGSGNVGKTVLQEESRVMASEQVEKRGMDRMAAAASSMNPVDKHHAAGFEHSADRFQAGTYDAIEKSGGMSVRDAMKEAGMEHKGPKEQEIKV